MAEIVLFECRMHPGTRLTARGCEQQQDRWSRDWAKGWCTSCQLLTKKRINFNPLEGNTDFLLPQTKRRKKIIASRKTRRVNQQRAACEGMIAPTSWYVCSVCGEEMPAFPWLEKPRICPVYIFGDDNPCIQKVRHRQAQKANLLRKGVKTDPRHAK